MGSAKQMTYEELLKFLEERQEIVIERLRRAGMFEPYFRRWALPPSPREFVVPGVNPAASQVVVETRIRATRSVIRRGST